MIWANTRLDHSLHRTKVALGQVQCAMCDGMLADAKKNNICLGLGFRQHMCEKHQFGSFGCTQETIFALMYIAMGQNDGPQEP